MTPETKSVMKTLLPASCSSAVKPWCEILVFICPEFIHLFPCHRKKLVEGCPYHQSLRLVHLVVGKRLTLRLKTADWHQSVSMTGAAMMRRMISFRLSSNRKRWAASIFFLEKQLCYNGWLTLLSERAWHHTGNSFQTHLVVFLMHSPGSCGSCLPCFC